MENTASFNWAAGLSVDKNAEATLVVRAQAGDTSAFDQLMRTYRERVWSVVNNLLGHTADATDVTQEAFIKAFTHIQKYNFQASFYTWLYRIAVNEAIAHRRKARLKRALTFERFTPNDDQDAHLDRAAASAVRVDTTLRGELSAQLNRALDTLSSDHRAVVVLAEIEGLPLEEVSQILHCSLGTVKSRLHYAKKQLQTQLKPYLSL